MKKALALIGTIIFVFSIVPMGAFADDDYVDHTSNIPPYVKGIIDLFSSTSYTLHFYDWEAWLNGSSVATSTSSNAPIVYYDTLDVDFQFTGQPASIINTVVMFELYLNNLYSIDYIELYSTSVHRNVSIFYYTYLHDSLYIVCSSETFYDTTDYTLRIHFTEDHTVTTISYSGLFGNVKIYHPENAANSYQYQMTEFYYFQSLINALNNINVSTSSSDSNTIYSLISSINDYMNTNFAYSINYTYPNSGYNYDIRYIYSEDDPSNLGNFWSVDVSSSTTGQYYFTLDSSDSILKERDLYIGFNTNIQVDPYATFIQVFIPVSSYSINLYTKVTCEYTGGSRITKDQVNRLDFNHDYSNFISYRFTTINSQSFMVFNIYDPQGKFNWNTPGGMLWIHCHFICNSGTGSIQFIKTNNRNINSYHTYAFADRMTGATLGIEAMLQMIIQNGLGGSSGSGGSVDYPDYPSGPSDPQDPNQTTNIYDVNIEFNNQVGDISVFEGTYSSQLPTYDQSINDQYLVPVSNSYDFSDLNSTFNSIWSSSFQYDTDEEDNITGVYGIGLYFIIPLVLLVLFALFRRITS